MREISSKDNKIYKLTEQLTQKKYRDRTGLYLIEGSNLIEEAVKNHGEIETIILDEVFPRESLFDKYPHLEAKAFLLKDKLFQRLSQTEHSQGIMAIVKKRDFSKDEAKNLSPSANFVILDRLQDPGNIGTILRTADAAGYALVIAMKGTGDVFSPKVVRSATGSLFRVPVLLLEDGAELRELIRAAGKRLVATAADGERCYYEENLKENIALIIGNEGQGISPELMEAAECKVRLPMKGNIESLNASVAAGILMYEAVRV